METLKTKINEQITTATEENSINPLILGSLMEETVDGIINIVVPTEISELNNDIGFITLAEVPSVYVPTELSELNNDVGYITLAQVPAGFDGDYNSLINKPFIPVDTNDLTNGAGFITMSQVPIIDLSPYATINYVNGLIGGLVIPTRTSDLINNSGFIDLSDLTWANISGKPNLFSGSYDDLTNKPTIPSDTSDLTNGAGYIVLNDLTGYATQDWVSDQGYLVNVSWNDVSGKPILFSGDYDDLTNKPYIPVDVSDLNNDVGYITLAEVPVVPTDLSELNNDVGFITINDVPSGFDGDYNSLTNKPVIPTNNNQLTNGAGYIDLSDLTWANISGKPNLFSGDYNDLTNKPTIPVDVSELNNNLGYITMADIPYIPYDTIELSNSAGFITLEDVQPTDIDILYTDTISFTEPQIYGSYSIPIFGPITFDLTDAKMGMIQEVYHEGSSMPTLPSSAKIVNDIEYSGTKVNLLLFKYTDNNRIEVVISVLEN